MQETKVQSLDREDPLEKEMATYSSILPGVFHGQRSLAGCSRTLPPLLCSPTTFSSSFCVKSASASLLEGQP